MPRPSLDPNKLIAFQRYINTTKKQRNLEGDEDDQLWIPSNCPPLDFVMGGGLPRGRVVEIYGGESTGKCVTGDTLITVPGEGILQMDELKDKATWRCDGDLKPDTVGRISLMVQATHGETEATHMYYAGRLQTIQLYTEQGHNICGSPTHRMLTLADNGIARWVTLQNARSGDQIISMVGANATGDTDILAPWFNNSLPVNTEEGAALCGALATAEERNGEFWIPTITAVQRQIIAKWFSHFMPHVVAIEDTGKFTSFSGLLKLAPEVRELVKSVTSREFLASVRKAKLNLQAAWIAGMTVINAKWTKNDLELEIENENVAKTFQAVSENLGVRWTRYSTLNTFGDIRYKLALRSRLDQQAAEALLWQDRYTPSTWLRQYAQEEDECHPKAINTLITAKRILEKKGVSFDFDVDDLSKENMQEVSDVFRVNAKNQTEQRIADTLDLLANEKVSFDRVTGTERGEVKQCWDFEVPIGHNYAANSLVSHNSTLAMHFCKQELETYPDSVCVYFDYERAMAKAYTKKMGLLKYFPRFQILDPDNLEEAEVILNGMYEEQMFPSIVVVDSVAAMTPNDLFGRDMEGAAPIGLQARKLSELLSKWTKVAGDYGTSILLLNQTRTFITMDRHLMGHGLKRRMVPGAPGSEKEDTPGGKAVKFYASERLRLEVKKVTLATSHNPMTGEEVETPVANVVKVIAAKNKLVQPYRQGTFYIEFGRGVDTIRTLMEVADTQKVLQRNHGGGIVLQLPSGLEIKAKGEENFVAELRANKQAQQELMTVLKWDCAEEIVNQATEIVTVSLNGERETTSTGLISKVKTLAESGLTCNLVEQAANLASKAQLLGLLDKGTRGNVPAYTAAGEEQTRAKTVEGLMTKLSGKAKAQMKQEVDEMLAAMKAYENGEVPGESEEETEAPPAALDMEAGGDAPSAESTEG